MPWERILSEGLAVMFDHGGICPCGRRTYLFGQCVKCIGDEAKETVADSLGRLDEAEADARDLGPGVYAGPLAAVQAAEAYSEKLLVLTDSAVLRASKAAGDGAEDVSASVWVATLYYGGDAVHGDVVCAGASNHEVHAKVKAMARRQRPYVRWSKAGDRWHGRSAGDALRRIDVELVDVKSAVHLQRLVDAAMGAGMYWIQGPGRIVANFSRTAIDTALIAKLRSEAAEAELRADNAERRLAAYERRRKRWCAP